MKPKYLLLSALVLAIGVSLFYAGVWFGGRRSKIPEPTPAISQPETDPAQASASGKPPAKPVPKAQKPPPVKPTAKAPVTATVSDKEYSRGKVIDPAGKPLAGAEITIGGAWVTHAVTGSDGKFRIEVPQLEWKPGG